MQTGNNNKFLRFWFEVSAVKANLKLIDYPELNQLKWLPYNKGGAYRKWYGNQEYVVDWFNNGESIKKL
ncbi:hypothetical protein ACU82A_11160 [Bacillus cereus]